MGQIGTKIFYSAENNGTLTNYRNKHGIILKTLALYQNLRKLSLTIENHYGIILKTMVLL